MKDLIKEDEFVTPVNYNPWKSFALFYCFAIAQAGIAQLITSAGNSSYQSRLIAGFFNMIAGITICLVMFLHKKQNLALPWPVKIKAVLLLIIINAASLLALAALSYNDFIDSFAFYFGRCVMAALIYLCMYGICCLVVYMVQKSKEKNGRL